jgi:hypothetical protein
VCCALYALPIAEWSFSRHHHLGQRNGETSLPLVHSTRHCLFLLVSWKTEYQGQNAGKYEPDLLISFYLWLTLKSQARARPLNYKQQNKLPINTTTTLKEQLYMFLLMILPWYWYLILCGRYGRGWVVELSSSALIKIWNIPFSSWYLRLTGS